MKTSIKFQTPSHSYRIDVNDTVAHAYLYVIPSYPHRVGTDSLAPDTLHLASFDFQDVFYQKELKNKMIDAIRTECRKKAPHSVGQG